MTTKTKSAGKPLTDEQFMDLHTRKGRSVLPFDDHLFLEDPLYVSMERMADCKKAAIEMCAAINDNRTSGALIPGITGTEIPGATQEYPNRIVINTVLALEHKCVPDAPASSVIRVGEAEYAQLSVRVCFEAGNALSLLQDTLGVDGFTDQQAKDIKVALLSWIDDSASISVSFCGPESAARYRSRVAAAVANEECATAEQLKRDRTEWERLNKIFGKKPAAKKSAAKKS